MSDIALTQNETGDWQGRATVLAYADSDGTAKLFPLLLTEEAGANLERWERGKGRVAVLMPITISIPATEIEAALADYSSTPTTPQHSSSSKDPARWFH